MRPDLKIISQPQDAARQPRPEDSSPVEECRAYAERLWVGPAAVSAYLNFRAFPVVMGAESLDWLTYAAGAVVSVGVAATLWLLWKLAFTLAPGLLQGEDMR